jgi:2-polyprenyl-3-methyl-5-hydroxy-6-metoxy-1,4-benzoquinol methylase
MRSDTPTGQVFHVEQDHLEVVPCCPICGSALKKDVFPVLDHTVSRRSFGLKDCGACGFRYTDPRPHQQHIGSYYASDSYISHTNSTATLQDKLYQYARKHALRRKYALIKSLMPQGKVLDLGCGTGEFLGYLRSRGYAVQGVEPDARAREQVIQKGIDVTASLDKIPSQEQFHVVTLWHVLEHLPDLRNVFKKLFALLSDGGLLVIAVPDRESWDASFYKANWAAWDVPRHLSHFRRKDVFRLLNEHGFSVVSTRRMYLDAFYIAMLSSRYRGAGTMASLFKGVFWGGVSNLIGLVSGRPTSSTLYVARKAEP